MSQRHPIQADEMMFITTNIFNRKPLFRNPVYAREAIETLYRVRKIHPFLVFGFVVMPDHLHFLVHIPDGNSISKVMRVYKRAVAFNIGRGAIWQHRFHIRIPGNASSVIRYMHNNPLKEGLAESAESYPWSSAHPQWIVDPLEVL